MCCSTRPLGRCQEDPGPCPTNKGVVVGFPCCGVPSPCPIHLPAHLSRNQSHPELSAKLEKATSENKDLSNRLKELNQVRLDQKSKIDDLLKQQAILLRNAGKGGNSQQQVQELVTYIEKQRDIYKANVEQLLSKLDPDKKFEATPSNYEAKDQVDHRGGVAGQNSMKVLKEIQNDSRRILQGRRPPASSSYRSSPYKSASPLRNTDEDSSSDRQSTAVRVRMANLQEEVLDLTEQVSELKLAKVQMQEKNRQETRKLEDLIRKQDTEIQTLKAERTNLEDKSDYRVRLSDHQIMA